MKMNKKKMLDLHICFRNVSKGCLPIPNSVYPAEMALCSRLLCLWNLLWS